MKSKKANLSQFAHPRNPYKNGVGDLEALAQNDSDFASVAKRNDAGGKIITDWSDRNYSKQLLKSVIKRDFNLNLKIPQGALAPALTNKFNYLLWIEDLAELNMIAKENISGIDIGTGPGLYFAALAARHFRWKMLATEANIEDYHQAQENMKNNDLNELIQLVLTDKHQLFKLPENNDSQFFFTLCNPPYYETHEEIRPREEFQGEMCGRQHEISIQGGEVDFVSQLIHESRFISSRVKVFSSMVGHKRNVSILREKLQGISEIKSISITELCQGRTMRWVIAWTYDPCIQLSITSIRAEAKIKEKEQKPITFHYKTSFHCLDISNSLKVWLSSLNVDVAKEGKTNEKTCYLRLKTTQTNWRGQRARRRAAEMHEPSMKKSKPNESEEEEIKLDCQLYLNKISDEDKVTFQFIYLDGSAGKNGMSELIQCMKRKLAIV